MNIPDNYKKLGIGITRDNVMHATTDGLSLDCPNPYASWIEYEFKTAEGEWIEYVLSEEFIIKDKFDTMPFTRKGDFSHASQDEIVSNLKVCGDCQKIIKNKLQDMGVDISDKTETKTSV